MPKFKSLLFANAAMLATRDVHDETGNKERKTKARAYFLAFCTCFVALPYVSGRGRSAVQGTCSNRATAAQRGRGVWGLSSASSRKVCNQLCC
jgi:hypothetical protein